MEKIGQTHKSLLIVVSLLTFLTASNTAIASLFIKEATLPPGLPVTIGETETVWGDIDFSHGFTSIESIAVTMNFGVDKLYFPTDTIVIGFPSIFGCMGMAFDSVVDAAPLSQYSFTLPEGWQDPYNALQDGSSIFYIEMAKGSVDIQGVAIEIAGTAVPVPGAVWLLGPGIVCITGLRSALRIRQKRGV